MGQDLELLNSPVSVAIVLRRSGSGTALTNIPDAGEVEFGCPGDGALRLAQEILAWHLPNYNRPHPDQAMCLRFRNDVIATVPPTVGTDIPEAIIQQWLSAYSSMTLKPRFIEYEASRVRSQLPADPAEAWLQLEQQNSGIAEIRRCCMTSAEENLLLIWACVGGGVESLRVAIATTVRKRPAELWPMNPQAWLKQEDALVPGFGAAASVWNF